MGGVIMSWAKESISIIARKRIPHRNWTNALSETFSALNAATPGEVVCITGPSRAGKSRLTDELIDMINPPVASRDEGIMPAVPVLATNCSVNGSFSTKSFTLRILKALDHPFYSVGSNGDDWDVEVLKRLDRTPEAVLRVALEQSLNMRKVKYLFIDEAQHVMYARGKVTAEAILQSLKCLAQSEGTVLVLVGAYPLLEVFSKAPHMVGRKHQIHLPRYYNRIEDIRAFDQILREYSKDIILPRNVSSLCAWNELLYGETMGCIGLLSKWLRRALSLVDARGDEELTFDHILESRMSAIDLEAIADEIVKGEEMLRPKETNVVKFKPKSKDNSKKKKSKRKAFQKKPKRYSIDGRS